MKKFNLFGLAGVGLTIGSFVYDYIKSEKDKQELKNEIKNELRDEIREQMELDNLLLESMNHNDTDTSKESA